MTFDDELRSAREKRAAEEHLQAEDDAAEARRLDDLREQARRQVADVRVALGTLDTIDPSSAKEPKLQGLGYWYAYTQSATSPKRQKWWKAPPPPEPARWIVSYSPDDVSLRYDTATKRFSFPLWSGTLDELAELGEVEWKALSETSFHGSRNAGRVGVPGYFTGLIRVIAQIAAANEPS